MLNNQRKNATSVQNVSYTYEGNAIKFSVNGKIMVCATEMSRPFGASKEPKHWLKLQSINEFISELSKVRNLTLADLVIVRKGGANPGTWFHEDVAIEFARWLSPRFGIWCNDRVKELLQGNTHHFPGAMTPTNCAILTCHTADGQSKQAYLMWGDDTWFQCCKWNGDREIIMKTYLGQIGSDDKEVVRYEIHAHLLKDGEWKPSCLLTIPVDKRPKTENAVTNCQKAIEKYNKAKEDVKTAASVMIDYMNSK